MVYLNGRPAMHQTEALAWLSHVSSCFGLHGIVQTWGGCFQRGDPTLVLCGRRSLCLMLIMLDFICSVLDYAIHNVEGHLGKTSIDARFCVVLRVCIDARSNKPTMKVQGLFQQAQIWRRVVLQNVIAPVADSPNRTCRESWKLAKNPMRAGVCKVKI